MTRSGSAAVVVIVAGLAAPAWAQYSGAVTTTRTYYPGRPPMPMPSGDDDEDGAGDEPGDMEGMYPGMRYGRPGAEGDPSMRPKTDLGKKIFTLDFTRTPQTVLGARAKLAAKAREKALNPDAPDKPEEVMPDAAPGMPGGGGDEGEMPGIPGGMEMPPELLARLAAMGAPLGGNAGAAGSVVSGPPGVEGEGAQGPTGPGAAGDATSRAEAAKEKAKKKTEEAVRIAAAAERFQRMVVAGEWAGVGEFLKKDAGEDAAAIYSFVLMSLERSDQALVPDEVLSISEAA